MNEYEMKKAERIERLRTAADKASVESESLTTQARKAGSVIPMGQPILVGHHSEKRDRNYRTRIGKTYDRAAEKLKKARDLNRKADAAEKNRAISSDDPDATVKLKLKITYEECQRSLIKSANRIARSKKFDKDQKILALVELLGISTARATGLLEPDYMGRVGFPAYMLTNMGANIRRMKVRLDQLQVAKKAEHVERDCGDGLTLVENVEENRMQLHFDEKPDKDTRRQLVRAGFRWSPSQIAWQRQLNNGARYAANAFAADWAASHATD